MTTAGDISSLIRDGAAALTGNADAATKLRLAKQALGILAPEYVPAIEGVGRLANHLGVKVTPEGLDMSGLRTLIAGEEAMASMVGEDRPWADFVSRVRHLRSGAVLILGPRGKGKTQLAVRLAEAWRREHGYDVLGINMYPEDRRSWMTWRSIKIFVDGIEQLTEALDQGIEPPQEIRRRVLIIDEAALSLHPQGSHTAALAVSRAIRQARHVEWLVVVVAHLTKDLPVQMTWMDAIFVKEPSGEEEFADREDSARFWQAAELAFKQLRKDGLRGKPIEAWVYAHAPDLGYKGMVHYMMAGEEDPHPGNRARRMDSGEVTEQC